MADLAMRERIETILDLGVDPEPGGSSCAQLELALTHLAEGKPEPREATGQLNGQMEQTLAQLFHLRDSQT